MVNYGKRITVNPEGALYGILGLKKGTHRRTNLEGAEYIRSSSPDYRQVGWFGRAGADVWLGASKRLPSRVQVGNRRLAINSLQLKSLDAHFPS